MTGRFNRIVSYQKNKDEMKNEFSDNFNKLFRLAFEQGLIMQDDITYSGGEKQESIQNDSEEFTPNIKNL